MGTLAVRATESTEEGVSHDMGEGYLDTLADEIRRQAYDRVPGLCLDRFLSSSPWSRRQTERRFRERFLTSPMRYFRDCQQEHAFALLSSGKDVLTTAIESGFGSTGRLHDAVVQRRGMTPGEIRRGGAGVCVRYAFFDTPLGSALLAGTERGLSALRLCQFADDASGDAALAEIEQDFPRATLIEDASAMQPYADQLVAFLQAQADNFAPRIDILTGTTFQREVWAEVQHLKPGDVVSYSELARRIGKPHAARAVAGACVANHLAIAIPCHRVCRTDGSVAPGKAWKEHLLAFEARRQAGTSRTVADC